MSQLAGVKNPSTFGTFFIVLDYWIFYFYSFSMPLAYYWHYSPTQMMML